MLCLLDLWTIPVTHGRAHHTRCVDTCSNTATDLQRLANQSHMLITHDVKHSAIHSDIRTQHQGKFHWEGGMIKERPVARDKCFFFFNFILFLNLQYCISFAKYRNESTRGIPAFPILNPPPSSLPSPPSGSSQCTNPKHPVPCIEPGLATRFIHDIIHVSMLFSQISPPSNAF